MKFRINVDFRFSVSRIIKFFIWSDIFLWSGWGLLSPILSVFVVQEVPGATLLTVGIGTAIYWGVKSLIQFPIARFLDVTDGERDDFYALVLGFILVGISAFSFTLVNAPWHLYVVQFIAACAFGLYVPAWGSLFSRHLDKNSVAVEWALDSSGIGIGSGITALAGSGIASILGFRTVFVIAGLFAFVGALLLIAVPRLIFPPPTVPSKLPIDHAKPL